MENKLIQTVNTLQPEMVQFCSRLLQIPSVNGINDEIDIAEAIAAQSQALGLHVAIVGQNPRRPNVIISTAAEGPTGLLLLGHLDTVPAGDEKNWTYPPFSGTVAGGRIYGRGAIDTKGGMTAALYALHTLARTPGALTNGRAQLICVPDEESGATGTLGIKYLHERGLLSALGAIYAYSGTDIILGHRGLLRYRLICEGQPVHTGALDWQDGHSGANAVTGMARLLLALENKNGVLGYSTSKYFERYKTFITPGTVINGGVSVNVVPDRCESLIDIRLTPTFDLARIDRLIQECIRETSQPRLRFEYELLNYAPAAISDETAPLFTILERVIEQVKGFKPPRVVAGPANEGYLLIERGIPTACGLGPTGENAHGTDEYVDIQGLVDAAAIFALAAQEMDGIISA
jgi:acetylornithine deacetylase/succinyl-diaminopimelate desuccinylase-like protein